MDKPHFSGHRERLKKRYIENGIESLNDYEILELLLFFSIPRKDTKPIAKELLKKFKTIKGIFNNLQSFEIKKIKGFGKNSFILFNLVKDIFSIIEKEKLFERKTLDNLEKVIKYATVSFSGKNYEEIRMLCLNSNNELLDEEVVDRGIVNEIVIYPRKIVEIALNKNATAVILIHNHPSGNPLPSKSDIETTKKLKNLLENIHIKLHDHIIISNEKYFSFKQHGII